MIHHVIRQAAPRFGGSLRPIVTSLGVPAGAMLLKGALAVATTLVSSPAAATVATAAAVGWAIKRVSSRG